MRRIRSVYRTVVRMRYTLAKIGLTLMSDQDAIKINLTDGGFVRLVDSMGSDLSVVNSARVSYDTQVSEMRPGKDDRLIKYLWEHQHSSPFRHATVQFHIKAPIFVLRQWMKHQVGCSWNERSGRYVKFNTEWWYPEKLSFEDDSKKQGSGYTLPTALNERALGALQKAYISAYQSYEHLIDLGVAKEQARAVLPVGMMSECYWTCSLQAALHFLTLRLDAHTQNETRSYACAVYQILHRTEQFKSVLDIWRADFLKNRPECVTLFSH